MYLNFNKIIAHGLKSNDIIALQAIREKNPIAIEYVDADLEKFEELGYITYVKKGHSDYDRVRLSKKGLTLLDSIQEPDNLDKARKLSKRLCDFYTSQNLRIGSKTKVESNLSWFLSVTVFKEEAVVSVIKRYVDDMKNQGKETYISNLDNLIWKQRSVFSVHKSLADSPLYSIILQYYNLDPTPLEKPNKQEEWIFKILSLGLPSKKFPKELTFNMEYDIFIEYLKELKTKIIRK